MRARAKVFAKKLIGLMHGQRCSFTTTTLRDDGKSLIERERRLSESFSKLMRQKFFKDNATGGACCLQITRGRHKDHWHIHLHILHVGKPFKTAELSSAWKAITGDSYIVHSRWVADATEDASYVARYATKGCEHDVLEDFEALLEAVVSLRGKRMLRTFGEWWGRGLDDECDDQTEWRRVGRLDHIASRARAGEAWAIGVFTSLGVKVSTSGTQLLFEDLDLQLKTTKIVSDGLPAP